MSPVLGQITIGVYGNDTRSLSECVNARMCLSPNPHFSHTRFGWNVVEIHHFPDHFTELKLIICLI